MLSDEEKRAVFGEALFHVKRNAAATAHAVPTKPDDVTVRKLD